MSQVNFFVHSKCLLKTKIKKTEIHKSSLALFQANIFIKAAYQKNPNDKVSSAFCAILYQTSKSLKPNSKYQSGPSLCEKNIINSKKVDDFVSCQKDDKCF
jgi:hypothetical protein